MSIVRSTRIQKPYDAAAVWTATNPILAAGETGYESDTHRTKTGDGSTVWNSLTYDDTPASGAIIHGAALKALPVAADEIGFWDSVANTLKKITFSNLLSYLFGYTTTVTAAGTTTLTVSSTNNQYFTGTNTQIVVMPVASTLTAGQSWLINNNSTGAITINSSGGNLIGTVATGTASQVTCILTSGTTAASWDTMSICSTTGNGGGAFSTGALTATTAAVGEVALFTNGGATPAALHIYSGTSIGISDAINGSGNGLGIITQSNALTINTASTERARIDASGNLLVGATGPLNSAAGRGNITINGSSTAVLSLGVGNVSKEYLFTDGSNSVLFNAGSGYTQIISGTNGVQLSAGATSWASASDERLKTELKPFLSASQKLLSWRAGTGRYKTDAVNVSRSFLIAQDVQRDLPEAVISQDDKSNTLMLSYTDTIPFIVAAVNDNTLTLQEALNRIEQLEASLAIVEGK